MQGHGKHSFLARFIQLLHTIDVHDVEYKRKKGANNDKQNPLKFTDESCWIFA